MRSHPNRASRLQPGEAILSLLAHAKLLVLARWCSSPQGAVVKAGDFLDVIRPWSSSHSWSRGRRTGNDSVRLTGMEECQGMNNTCPILETSQRWASRHLVCVHGARCMARQSYGVSLCMNPTVGVSVVHLAVCTNLP